MVIIIVIELGIGLLKTLLVKVGDIARKIEIVMKRGSSIRNINKNSYRESNINCSIDNYSSNSNFHAILLLLLQPLF